MIKRWIAGMLGAAVIAGGALTAAAAEISAPETALPFVLEAPSHVSLVWWEGGDTLTTMQADYSMNDSMCQWLGKYSDSKTKEETLKALRESTGFSDLSVAAQIDWAIDDPEKGWHYTAFWDGDDTHGIGVQRGSQPGCPGGGIRLVLRQRPDPRRAAAAHGRPIFLPRP